METFKGAEVAPINEMLERTHYVKALREDIANLGGERDALAAQLEWRGAQFSVVIHERDDALTKLADAQAEIARLTAERDDLAGKLAAAHQELHDLRIRVGLGVGCTGVEYPTLTDLIVRGDDLRIVIQWAESEDQFYAILERGDAGDWYELQAVPGACIEYAIDGLDSFSAAMIVDGQPTTGKGV